MAEPIKIPFGGLISVVSPTNHVLDGAKISTGMGNFWGLTGPLKIIRSLCCHVRSKRDHSILNNCTPCDVAFCKNSLTTC